MSQQSKLSLQNFITTKTAITCSTKDEWYQVIIILRIPNSLIHTDYRYDSNTIPGLTKNTISIENQIIFRNIKSHFEDAGYTVISAADFIAANTDDDKPNKEQEQSYSEQCAKDFESEPSLRTGRTICGVSKTEVGKYYTECPKCGFLHIEVMQPDNTSKDKEPGVDPKLPPPASKDTGPETKFLVGHEYIVKLGGISSQTYLKVKILQITQKCYNVKFENAPTNYWDTIVRFENAHELVEDITSPNTIFLLEHGEGLRKIILTILKERTR